MIALLFEAGGSASPAALAELVGWMRERLVGRPGDWDDVITLLSTLQADRSAQFSDAAIQAIGTLLSALDEFGLATPQRLLAVDGLFARMEPRDALSLSVRVARGARSDAWTPAWRRIGQEMLAHPQQYQREIGLLLCPADARQAPPQAVIDALLNGLAGPHGKDLPAAVFEAADPPAYGVLHWAIANKSGNLARLFQQPHAAAELLLAWVMQGSTPAHGLQPLPHGPEMLPPKDETAILARLARRLLEQPTLDALQAKGAGTWIAQSKAALAHNAAALAMPAAGLAGLAPDLAKASPARRRACIDAIALSVDASLGPRALAYTTALGNGLHGGALRLGEIADVKAYRDQLRAAAPAIHWDVVFGAVGDAALRTSSWPAPVAPAPVPVAPVAHAAAPASYHFSVLDKDRIETLVVAGELGSRYAIGAHASRKRSAWAPNFLSRSTRHCSICPASPGLCASTVARLSASPPGRDIRRSRTVNRTADFSSSSITSIAILG